MEPHRLKSVLREPCKHLPAQKTGGLYKTHCARKAGFVEAVPSHTFRDGTGIFVIKLRRPEVSAIKD
jgi:hypothetical protein